MYYPEIRFVTEITQPEEDKMDSREMKKGTGMNLNSGTNINSGQHTNSCGEVKTVADIKILERKFTLFVPVRFLY